MPEDWNDSATIPVDEFRLILLLPLRLPDSALQPDCGSLLRGEGRWQRVNDPLTDFVLPEQKGLGERYAVCSCALRDKDNVSIRSKLIDKAGGGHK